MARDLAEEISYYDFCSEGLTFSDPDLVFAIPATREKIHRLLGNTVSAEEDNPRLKRVDAYVLANIDGLPEDYDEDDPSQPPEKWWWHLKEIKAGTFPKEHLPQG